MTPPKPRSLLLLLLLIPVVGRAQPHRVDTAGFVLHPIGGLNSPSDEYAVTISPTRTWLMLTSARDGHSTLYRSRKVGGEWGTPQRVVNEKVLDPRTDNGALALALPREVQLGPLSDAEMTKLVRGDAVLGVLVTGKRPGTLTDADLAAVRVRWSDGAMVPDVHLIENIHLASDGSRPDPADSAEEEPLNSTWWDSQAALAPDGSFVVFASARPDGVGGADLWIADRGRNGRYAAVRNLGGEINSDANDFSPFLAQDGRTLFFASTREGGFGGSDIYRTQRGADGRWSEPENLGAAINTEANEAFFFGLGRERCIVASDRPGGAGGFDLYEGYPNIFATGYTLLRVRMVDTVGGAWLGGSVRVYETGLDHLVNDIPIDPASGGMILLPSGFSYRLELRTLDDSVQTVVTRMIPPDTNITLDIGFHREPPLPPPPEVTLSIEGVNLPLYVSGYYRLNTPASLDSLRAWQQTSSALRSSNYIADVRNDSIYAFYSEQAVDVEREIDRFVRRALTNIFPVYQGVRKPGEYLEINVIGYADPRPIVGSYREEQTVFYDSARGKVVVKRGARLTNHLLAGLRAAYAVSELDARFRAAEGAGRDLYEQMVADGAIRWRPISADVDTGQNDGDLAQRRRIVVVLRRVEP